ncbi:MAG: polyphenol oxidase family protein [Candidatus Omnitrophica bacterium]|nr:polyphenol oxidase family protein [Candidatus Omnitrophota bacterium]
MKISEKENFFSIEDFFDSSVIAGYSKPKLAGTLPDDFYKAFSCSHRDFSLSYMKQLHSDKVHVVGNPGEYSGDGLFTSAKKHFLVVKTADCLPLFFFSKRLSVAGVVHMGWRSAAGGILENIPYDLSTFKVVAGVGMRCCCYEVGKELEQCIRIKPYLKSNGERIYFDPIAFVCDSLARRGMPRDNFLDLDYCTVCHRDNFLSFRKTATSKRMLSFIGFIE